MVLCHLHHVLPQDYHVTDKPDNRYYLGGVHGFLYMSELVHAEVKALSDTPALFYPHPLFEIFGELAARK